MVSITETCVRANGIDFVCLEAGQGPLALCFHGFPDSPHSYRHLIQELAAAGYRAVAPFLRGYAPTSIPADQDYETSTLARDVSGLHEALGGGPDAVLIGHDWGAGIVYCGASFEPERWRSCVAMSIPPLAVFGQVGFGYEQLKREFHFWFFQMAVADTVILADDMAFIDCLWKDWSPGFDATAELGYVKKSLGTAENLSAALGYYRALFNPAEFGTPAGLAKQGPIWGRPLTQPTLYLHGDDDGCVALDEKSIADVPTYLGPGSRAELVPGAGHFLLQEKPAEVNARILEFLGAPR